MSPPAAPAFPAAGSTAPPATMPERPACSGKPEATAAHQEPAPQPKPFLRRRSTAVPPHKLDWSKVESRISTKLDPNFILDRSPGVCVW